MKSPELISADPPIGRGRRFARRILSLTAAAVLLILAVRLAGPRLARWIILRQMSFGNLQARTVEIRRLGFRETEAAGFTLRGDGPIDVLSVDRVRLRYRPDRLLRGGIDGVYLSGLTLNLVGDESGIRPAGTEPTAGFGAPPGGYPRLGEISLESSRVVVRWAGRTLAIPFSATLRPAAELDRYAVELLAGPEPFEAAAAGVVDIAAGDADLSFSISELSPAAVLDYLGWDVSPPFAARVSAGLTARLRGWLPSRGEYRTTWRLAASPGPLELRGGWSRGGDGSWEITGKIAQEAALNWGGVKARGGLRAAGSALLGRGRIQSEALIDLDDWNIEFRAGRISAGGVSGEIALDDVLGLTSAGPQTIQVGTLRAGGLAMNSGVFTFSLLGPGEVRIERGVIEAAGGRLVLEDGRMGGNARGAEGRFLCEEMRLAELINLMDWITAEGTAAVSGVILFRLGDEGLRLEDGYLETAPGQSSRLRIGEARFLTRGLPADHPGYMYASIAEEAMQDFRCDWARADLRLAEGRLSVTLSIRGAPNRELPFGFDLEKQAFYRAAPGESNADFSNGLTLTLNLKDIIVEDILAGASALEIYSGNTQPGGSP